MSNLLVLSFTYDPTLLSVEPPSGNTAGGDVVEIVGLQFADEDDFGIDVFFGTQQVPTADVLLLNETRIRVVVPEGLEAGPVDLRVDFPSGVSKTLATAFTYDDDAPDYVGIDETTQLVTDEGDFIVT